MTAWPFLLSASRRFEYRIIILPDFIRNDRDIDALTKILDSFLQDDSTPSDFRRFRSVELGQISIWYERVAAKIGNIELRDRVGRTIYRIQGILFRNTTPDWELGKDELAELVDRLRSEAQIAYESFSSEKSKFDPVLAKELKLEEKKLGLTPEPVKDDIDNIPKGDYTRMGKQGAKPLPFNLPSWAYIFMTALVVLFVFGYIRYAALKEDLRAIREAIKRSEMTNTEFAKKVSELEFKITALSADSDAQRQKMEAVQKTINDLRK